MVLHHYQSAEIHQFSWAQSGARHIASIECVRVMRGKRSERFRYLEELLQEFQTSNSSEARIQVLANLANFAYDASNAEYLVQLRLPGVLVALLQQDQQQLECGLKQLVTAAVCNLSVHPAVHAHLVSCGIVQTLSYCLDDHSRYSRACASSSDEPAAVWQQTAINSVGALFFLLLPRTASDVHADLLSDIASKLRLLAGSVEPRLAHLSSLLLKQLNV